jgi:geranylgeranyl pyrophosphate synthase
LFIKAVELADDRDREALISHYSTPTGKQEDQVDRVRAIFRRCGTDELLLHEIERFTDLALERVDRLSVDDGGKELLRQFCYRLMKRKV